MKLVSKENALELAIKYLKNNNIYTPYFICVDGIDEYVFLRDKLSTLLSTQYTSNFCIEDTFPDYDKLYDNVVEFDENLLLLGLGESLLFYGNSNILGMLKDLYLEKKVIILVRFIRSDILKFNSVDTKFNSRKFCIVDCEWRLTALQYASELRVSADADCFQSLLSLLERNPKENVNFYSNLLMNNTTQITTPYALIKLDNPNFTLSQDALSFSQWQKYIEDNTLEGSDISHWRSFIKEYLQPSSNYMNLVISKSKKYDEYKENLLSSILSVDKKDKIFKVLYDERKELLKTIKSIDVTSYINKCKIIDYKDRIYYFTDNTKEEKKAILSLFQHLSNIPKDLEYIYPDLSNYLKVHSFIESSDITNYFNKYKQIKLFNKFDHDFNIEVEKIASSGNRLFNNIQTRGSVIEKLDECNNKLYWLDALGVEYISFIKEKSKDLNISCSVTIAKSELPTLTSVNSDFYINWKNAKIDNKNLDNIKHNKSQVKYDGKDCSYLVDELEIIDNVLNEISNQLKNKQIENVVLTSDHGASRLVILCNKESSWKMLSKGQHSGRCCPASDLDSVPDCATKGYIDPGTSKEQEYWVLANYDRFQGGRMHGIELHGGASLEEVLVPIFVFSLINNELKFENVTPEGINVEFGKSQFLILFCETCVDQIEFRFDGCIYTSCKEENNPNKHRIIFNTKQKSGDFEGEIYVNSKYQHSVKFKIKNAINNNDNDFFS